MKKFNVKNLDILNDKDIENSIGSSVVEEMSYCDFKGGEVLKVEFGSRGEFIVEEVKLDSEGNFELVEMEELEDFCEEDREEYEEIYYCDFEKMKDKNILIWAFGDEWEEYYFRYERG